MPIRFSTSTAFVVCAATTALTDTGSIEVYDGVPPGNADTPVTTQTLLGTFFFSGPPYGDPQDGGSYVHQIAELITGGVPVADGDATWYRLKTSTGDTVWDGDCGPVGSGASLELDNITFTIGQLVTITLGDHVQPKE